MSFDFLPTTFKSGLNNFKYIDPLLYGSTNATFKAEDRAAGSLWDKLGVDSMADYHKKDAKNPASAWGHRAIAALAYMGGSAALGGGGGGAGGTAANMNATNPALIDSAMGTPGYGASSAGPGGMGAALPMGGQQMPQMQQQQKQQPDNSQRQMLMWAEMLRQQQEQQRHAMEDASLQRGNR